MSTLRNVFRLTYFDSPDSLFGDRPPETAHERVREQIITERQATSEAGRDPIDTFGVARARGRLRELDEWIAGVNPAGSREVLEGYELERRALRAWLARGRLSIHEGRGAAIGMGSDL